MGQRPGSCSLSLGCTGALAHDRVAEVREDHGVLPAAARAFHDGRIIELDGFAAPGASPRRLIGVVQAGRSDSADRDESGSERGGEEPIAAPRMRHASGGAGRLEPCTDRTSTSDGFASMATLHLRP